MVTSSLNLVDNHTEGIHKIKCQDCDCFIKCENIKDSSIKYKCLSCNKKYSNKIDEELNNRLKNTFKFSNNDLNKFILSLRKGVYPHEYTDEWGKFTEALFPEKAEFYGH